MLNGKGGEGTGGKGKNRVELVDITYLCGCIAQITTEMVVAVVIYMLWSRVLPLLLSNCLFVVSSSLEVNDNQ